MSDFDLDLGAIERDMDEFEERSVVLGVLDGGTPDESWLAEIDRGNVLVLHVDGDLNALASGFAGDVRDGGGALVHFREFLIVAPSDVDIDTERLNE